MRGNERIFLLEQFVLWLEEDEDMAFAIVV